MNKVKHIYQRLKKSHEIKEAEKKVLTYFNFRIYWKKHMDLKFFEIQDNL